MTTVDPPETDLPAPYKLGRIVGRVAFAVGDSTQDEDQNPGLVPVTGERLIQFVPADGTRIVSGTDPVTRVDNRPISADLDVQGDLSRNGQKGIKLWCGVWTCKPASPTVLNFDQFDFELTEAHTDDAPLQLWSAAPYTPPEGTTVNTLVVPSGASNGQVLAWGDDGLAWQDGASGEVSWDDVAGKPSTFPPTIGTTATTAMAGNTAIPAAPTADTLSGATAVGKQIIKATDAAAARTAIGAGTSSLALGTTATTAAKGDHTHSYNDLTDKPAIPAAPAEERLVPTGGTTNQVLKVGSDGKAAWGADANTQPPTLTADAVQAGTATTPSSITAKVLADEIDRRVAAAIAALPSGG
jgi:hypothetical protein